MLSLNAFLSLGIILLFGLLSARLINLIRLPSVTAYLVLGILSGPSFVNIISPDLINASGFISNLVLSIIAFSIGQNFSLDSLARIGKQVLWISILEAAGAWFMVTSVFFLLLRQPLYVAILFGAIAAATAPAATVMIVREYKAKGTFTNLLLSVVAIDDAWCLIIFAVSLSLAMAMKEHLNGNAWLFSVLLRAGLEIAGSALLGILCALLLTTASKYIGTRTDLLLSTLGVLLLNAGVSIFLHFSVLLSGMFFGAGLINMDKQGHKFFDILKTIDSPFYLIFFILAGSNLELAHIRHIGTAGVFYILFRVFGKITGAYAGGIISEAPQNVKKYLGMCLVPQAGVALGCAMIVKHSFPAVGGFIYTTIIATTVIFEIIGPVLTRIGLHRSGEIA